MLDESCVQVAVYDDRLEVTSPGGLYNGLTYDEMLNGRSVLRNRVIANVFNQMGLIEAWGTGIKRIREEAAKYRLRDPEFLEFDDMFRINLYRYTDDANDANRDANDANHDANDTDQFIGSARYSVNNLYSHISLLMDAAEDHLVIDDVCYGFGHFAEEIDAKTYLFES